jgi:hypothetical protein
MPFEWIGGEQSFGRFASLDPAVPPRFWGGF